MLVYTPDSVDEAAFVDRDAAETLMAEQQQGQEPPQAPPVQEPSQGQIVETIRRVTNPAVAKRTMDAKIVQVAATNRARAENTMRSIGVPIASRSATMNGLWSWLTSSGKLSDLSRYTPAQREALQAYLKAASLDVIEKTFTQEELDAVAVKMAAGVPAPANATAIVDPYSAAAQAYQAEVVSALAPMGETATTAGGNAAKTVGNAIVNMYQVGTDTPGRSFEWFGKAKWVIGLTALGFGGYMLWPTLKKYAGEGAEISRALNTLRNVFAGGGQ
jgi:hypothetical protein